MSTTDLLLSIHQRLEVNDNRRSEVATTLPVEANEFFSELLRDGLEFLLTPLNFSFPLHQNRQHHQHCDNPRGPWDGCESQKNLPSILSKDRHLST